MKIIKYMLFQGRINHGTEEEPKWEDIVIPKKVSCTAENLSANEEIAKKEAYKGEYTIEDDGKPEPEPAPSEESVWDELDEAYQKGVDSV